jgi:hypothetical protein
MSETNRFPEITACQAAEAALKNFDAAFAPKLNAFISLGKVLESGGWGAVRFVEETPLSGAGLPAGTKPISRNALDGDGVGAIIAQRRVLMERWKSAYETVPIEIRASAPAPIEGHQSMIQSRLRRG